MEIHVHISRSHAIAAALALVLITTIAVVMATGFTAGQPSHQTLFTDTIRGKTGGSVSVQDNLGVGTSTPTRRLEVADTSGGIAIPLRITGTFASGANTGVGIDFHQGVSFPLGQITAVHTGANSEDFYFNLEGNNNLQNAVRMEGATGNVFARGSFVPGSDARYKTDVQDLQGSLDRVLALRGVSYVKKDDPAKRRQVGLIAQEVEPIVPEVVYTDSKGMKGLAYENLVALLIESVKDLKAQNDELRTLLCLDHPDAKACA